jgi:hypothetical protein
LQTELKVAGTKNDYISSEFKTETRKKTVDWNHQLEYQEYSCTVPSGTMEKWNGMETILPPKII